MNAHEVAKRIHTVIVDNGYALSDAAAYRNGIQSGLVLRNMTNRTVSSVVFAEYIYQGIEDFLMWNMQ